MLCVLTCLSGCAAQAGARQLDLSRRCATWSLVCRPGAPRSAGWESARPVHPERLTLPGNATAAVLPAVTVDGVLRVPEDVEHVGWWDGSAQVGEPFGSTVIAGHVDSATDGIGFFARLLRIKRATPSRCALTHIGSNIGSRR